MSRSDPRAVSALDLLTVRRLYERSLPLDMVTALTNGISGVEHAALAAVPLTDLGAPTVILRNGHGGYVGQFRHRLGEQIAQLSFLAPEPREGDCRAWAQLLEAVVAQAGRRGAHLVCAEIAEDHPAFVAFRMAGFAVYSRQVLLRHAPAPITAAGSARGLLRPAQDRDAFSIALLHANTVPRLLQQADPLPDVASGLVYERDGQIGAYLAITQGKLGIVIKPYFHPEVYDQAAAAMQAALELIPHTDELPVYVYARAYQDWLRGVLEQVGFRAWADQALLVKYTVVRVERVEAATVSALETARRQTPAIDGPIFHPFKSDDRFPPVKRGTKKAP
ncbi:MAG: hypothetical protein IT325_06890 [Anaerolineae bacterium]|nr:hypothetical protein [Anaerolineae bacterium]